MGRVRMVMIQTRLLMRLPVIFSTLAMWRIANKMLWRMVNVGMGTARVV